MDDLVLAGAAGIIVLVIAGLLLLYGAANILIVTASALASGEFALVLLIAAAVIGLLAVYVASGLWLRKTDRI